MDCGVTWVEIDNRMILLLSLPGAPSFAYLGLIGRAVHDQIRLALVVRDVDLDLFCDVAWWNGRDVCWDMLVCGVNRWG